MTTSLRVLSVSFLSILFLATCSSEDGKVRTGKENYDDTCPMETSVQQNFIMDPVPIDFYVSENERPWVAGRS